MRRLPRGTIHNALDNKQEEMVDTQNDIVELNIRDEDKYFARPFSIEEYIVLHILLNPLIDMSLISRGSIRNDTILELASIAGVEQNVEDYPQLINIIPAIQKSVAVSARYDALRAELRTSGLSLSASYTHNINKLQREAGLDEEETLVISFLIVISELEMISMVAQVLGPITIRDFQRLISSMLDLELKTIQRILSPKSRLTETSLYDNNDYTTTANLRERFSILDGIGQRCYEETIGDDEHIFDKLYKRTRDTKLKMSDYAHIKDTVRILSNRIKSSQTGGNILIYGPPGTGKTEFARLMAQTHDKELYEISSEDEYGGTRSTYSRLKILRLSQYVLGGSTSAILYDEIDGSFDYTTESEDRPTVTKAWMTDLLDSATIPSFWVINSLRGVDIAFLRRFDMVIEMPHMNSNNRRSVVRRYAKENDVPLDYRQLDNLLKFENLSPAVIERAMSVVGTSKSTDKIQNSKDLVLLCNGTLAASGFGTIYDGAAAPAVTKYNLSYMNVDVDAQLVIDGVKRTKKGLFCFYGAPGTGKSEFAKYIAHRAGMSVISKKVSDLSSMYVGEAEKNIARAFEEAQDTKSLLIFDEADSFLSDRRGAKNSWEVTQVNEMLTQMENYRGVFVATTNLMEGLDQASIRRFGLKLKFGWMSATQAEAMLRTESRGRVDEQSVRRVRAIKALAPGDFAAVKKRLLTLDIKQSAKNLVEGLEHEVSLKHGVRTSSIGFHG